MTTINAQQCTHLNQHLRWLGVRRDHGGNVYLFQCTGCGKTLSTHSALGADHETGPLMKLSRPADV